MTHENRIRDLSCKSKVVEKVHKCIIAGASAASKVANRQGRSFVLAEACRGDGFVQDGNIVFSKDYN